MIEMRQHNLPLHHGQHYKEIKFVIAVALVFACAIACCQCLKGGKHASAAVSQLLMRWMMLLHVLLPWCMLSCVQLSFATAADVLIARMLCCQCCVWICPMELLLLLLLPLVLLLLHVGLPLGILLWKLLLLCVQLLGDVTVCAIAA